jgi:hypothetical protein
MLASVAGEVAVVAVDHDQAGAHVAGEVEGRDAGTQREGREGVSEIVDPPRRIDAGGLPCRSPLVGAEVVDVEVAAPPPGNSSGEPLRSWIRLSASSARACNGTARMLASVFGIFSSPRVNERRT